MPYFIGIDIGGTNIESGIIGDNYRIFNRKSTPTFVHEGKERVLDRICGLIQELIEENPLDSIKGIGIGSAGVINIEDGIIVTSPNFPDWKNVPLKDIIFKKFGIETILDNDANVVIFGEYLVGAAKGASSLIGLTLGTGVGGAIILDGKIWHGCEGMAGEIGHMTIYPDGHKCGCGNFGCLEAYASAKAIVNQARERISHISKNSVYKLAGVEDLSELTAAHIYKAAIGGDELAIGVLSKVGEYLGLALGSLTNIFNPDMIIIGGGVINAWDFFYSSLINEVKKRAFSRPAERVKILPAKLGKDAGIIGAAGLVARSAFF